MAIGVNLGQVLSNRNPGTRTVSQNGPSVATRTAVQAPACRGTRAAVPIPPASRSFFRPVTAGSARVVTTTGAPGTPMRKTGFDENTWTTFNQKKVSADSCGTTALAMVFAHYGLIGKNLEAARAVDRAVRPYGGFSAPDDLKACARSKGLQVSGFNDSNFNEITAQLRAGRTVMAMVDRGAAPHWVVVLNTYQNAAGAKILTVADPATGETRAISKSAFEQSWESPNRSRGGFFDDVAGFRNYLLVFDRNFVPPGREFGITYARAAADGMTDVWTGAGSLGAAFTRGEAKNLISGPIGIAGGLISMASAVPGTVGRIAEVAGERTLDWASRNWHAGGIGGKVLGGLGYAGGGLLKGAGWAVRTGGEFVAAAGYKIGTAVTSAGKAVANGVARAGSAVVSGVKSATKTVVSGAKTAAKAVGSGIKTAAKTVGSGVASAAKAVGNGIKNAAEAVWDGVTSIFSGW